MGQRVILSKFNRIIGIVALIGIAFIACTKKSPVVSSAPGAPVATIDGIAYTMDDLGKKSQGEFFEIEQKKYELIRQAAMTIYFEKFWEDEAKKLGVTVAEARQKILDEKAKVSDENFKKTYDQLKNHPQLASRPEEERKKEIRNYLKQQAEADYMQTLVKEAESSGSVEINYPEPQEPTYNIAVRDDDQIRFGPGDSDIKPISCKGDDCITIIEYSGFQCPACRQSAGATMEVLNKYKGKIRWVMRDFPLSFHKRSTPAAIAAHCAGDQDKYWHMYSRFYENGKLEDADIQANAKEFKLDMKAFNECLKSEKYAELVEKNLQSGIEYSVNGTPAFFINGRKLGGVNQFSAFQKIIDDELKKKG